MFKYFIAMLVLFNNIAFASDEQLKEQLAVVQSQLDMAKAENFQLMLKHREGDAKITPSGERIVPHFAPDHPFSISQARVFDLGMQKYKLQQQIFLPKFGKLD